MALLIFAISIKYYRKKKSTESHWEIIGTLEFSFLQYEYLISNEVSTHKKRMYYHELYLILATNCFILINIRKLEKNGITTYLIGIPTKLIQSCMSYTNRMTFWFKEVLKSKIFVSYLFLSSLNLNLLESFFHAKKLKIA